jgi:hypothetical protein
VQIEAAPLHAYGARIALCNLICGIFVEFVCHHCLGINSLIAQTRHKFEQIVIPTMQCWLRALRGRGTKCERRYTASSRFAF